MLVFLNNDQSHTINNEKQLFTVSESNIDTNNETISFKSVFSTLLTSTTLLLKAMNFHCIHEWALFLCHPTINMRHYSSCQEGILALIDAFLIDTLC